MITLTSLLHANSSHSNRLFQLSVFKARTRTNALLELCLAQQSPSALARMLSAASSGSPTPLTIEAVQAALDTFGARINTRIAEFIALRPEEKDADVNRQWRALAQILTGVLHWSFESEQYFRPSAVGTHIAMHRLFDAENFPLIAEYLTSGEGVHTGTGVRS